MSQYRRHHPRAANPSVILELPGDQGPVPAPVRDLSAGGVRVCVASTVPVGAELDVRLSDATSRDDDAVLRLRARVLRIQSIDGETGIALEFVDRVESSSIRLHSWVESLRRNGGGGSPAGVETVGVPRVAGPASSPRSSSAEPTPTPSTEASAEAERRRTDDERRRLEGELRAQVERGDRAESALETLRDELAEERERREAAERTLVTLQAELSRVRCERGELESLRHEVEELRSGSEGAPTLPIAGEDRPGEEGEGRVHGAPAPGRPAAPGELAASGGPSSGVEESPALSLGPEEICSRVVFSRYLRDGAKLRPTDRFERFDPVSRLDIRVHDYARRADGLAEIRKLAARRLSEDEILRVLFNYFERGLLRLEPAGPVDVMPAASSSTGAAP